MTGTLFDNEVRGHDANHARGNPGDESPENDSTEASAPGELLENGGKNQPRERRGRVFLGGILIFGLLMGGGIYYWLLTRNVESTSDAYTDGRAVSIAPQVSGRVISLDVTDNEFVHKEQALIHIDPRQYENDRDSAQGALDMAQHQLAGQKFGAEIARKNFPALLKQAQAQLASAQATEAKAQADDRRQRSLPKAATTQQEIDAATAALRQAQAQVLQAEAQVIQAEPVPQHIGEVDTQVGQLKGQVEQAQAKLDQALLNLSWTVVTAPQDGWITKRNVEIGDYVTAGQQIFSIVAPEVWITANFKESQLDRIRRGQSVTIRLDAYPSLDLTGHVDSIQLGSGSKFTAFPPENATGNFIKIVQRVPVKIVIDKGLQPDIPLPLGISAVPTVTVR
ncbi:MAG: HlyD family secretion protein [Methylocella sp.]|nr:MAG: multidrug export protein EmrA [Hyphomicrobiales bacterium]